MPIFDKVEKAPEDPILGLTVAFNNDKHPDKVNVGVGAYRTEEGKPYVLPVVHKVEEALLHNPAVNHEYLPIDGLADFRKYASQLIFGENSKALAEGRIATVQTISGTGSLRVGAEFAAKFLPGAAILISTPTWGNHLNIFPKAGVQVRKYRYYSNKLRGLDFEGLIEDLSAAPEGSLVLLHGCAHNPTGCDPTRDQWARIADVCEARKLVPYFDVAYQGFASGDLDADAWSVRFFEQRGFTMLVSQSFAKNMGLYGERAGALNVVCSSADEAGRVLSQLKPLIRVMYSNPPAHGARIAAAILGDKALFAQWGVELKGMADRIIKMRHAMFDELKALGTPGTWDHIVSQIGMFSYTGLTEAQVLTMRDKFHIYMTTDGRISMAGVNSSNVKYICKSMHEAIASS
eukprot:tig00020553_g10630.t1